jgi:hypothetical protein
VEIGDAEKKRKCENFLSQHTYEFIISNNQGESVTSPIVGNNVVKIKRNPHS